MTDNNETKYQQSIDNDRLDKARTDVPRPASNVNDDRFDEGRTETPRPIPDNSDDK